MLARKKLTFDDVAAIRTLPHVVAADGGVRHANPIFQAGVVGVKYGQKMAQGTLLQGDSVQVSEVADLPLIEGRVFTQEEDERRANVTILGYDTAQQLFGDESGIGKEVTIENNAFTVIGVFDKRKQAFGGGRNPDDNAAFFPIGTFMKLHPEDAVTGGVWVSVKYDDPKFRSLVEDEVRELLRRRRKVRVESPDDFEIFSPDSLTRLWNQLTGGLAIFMVAVSSVGLMVGGVGVMNIMLVSVTERTKEIGVRKAIGATKRNILMQFTIEAITLCALGGVIGIITGGVITLLIRLLLSALPATMSSMWAMIGFTVSCMIGLVFGIYPAWKAANLDPIEALRYE
jgi:putative ABC transport system permease protein